MMLSVSVALPQPRYTGGGGSPPPPPLELSVSGTDTGTGTLFAPGLNIPLSDANRLLVLEVKWNEALEALVPAPLVTYDGVPCTLLAGSDQVAGISQSAIYSLVAPATGLKEFSIEFEAPVTYRAYFQAFRNADPTTPFGATAGATGTGTAPAVTVSPAPPTSSRLCDALLADLLTASTTATKHASQTQVDNALVGVSPTRMRAAASWKADGGAAMSWTLNASKPWALFAYEVRQAP